jgi:asparagine synthase (glutamine-hydrolysing)
MELAWGYLMGHEGTLPPPSHPQITPRAALELVSRRALERPPCGVAFSGGRDSSLVLAIATHVARRDGLPDPVPITRVFPGIEEADEHEFQEAVVRHLGLPDWHRVTFEDELDVIGPIAARHLLAHGVVWPPNIGTDVPLVDAVPGGSVLDGEGGDDVLGVEFHRIRPLTRLLRQPRPLTWRRVRSAAGALAPAVVRGRYERKKWDGPTFVTWLRPEAMKALVDKLAQLERDRPLAFASSVKMVPRRRTQLLLAHNRRILATERDVDFRSPLLDPEVVHAFARDGGLFGRPSRTDAMRALASDLLPDTVLSRTSKANFTRCYHGRPTYEFAARWSGDGVDASLVDPEELRRIWLTERPAAPTSALLQSAWLAGTRPSMHPAPSDSPLRLAQGSSTGQTGGAVGGEAHGR